jgi:hypothetical protein
MLLHQKLYRHPALREHNYVKRRLRRLAICDGKDTKKTKEKKPFPNKNINYTKVPVLFV